MDTKSIVMLSHFYVELGWDLTDQTVLDVQLLLNDKSDIWTHTLLYPFSSLATNSTVSNHGTSY